MAGISRGRGLIRRQAVVEDKVRNLDGQMLCAWVLGTGSEVRAIGGPRRNSARQGLESVYGQGGARPRTT